MMTSPLHTMNQLDTLIASTSDMLKNLHNEISILQKTDIFLTGAVIAVTILLWTHIRLGHRT